MVPPPLEEKDEIPRMVDAPLRRRSTGARLECTFGLLDALEERAPEAKVATDGDEDLLAALTQDGPNGIFRVLG